MSILDPISLLKHVHHVAMRKNYFRKYLKYRIISGKYWTFSDISDIFPIFLTIIAMFLGGISDISISILACYLYDVL